MKNAGISTYSSVAHEMWLNYTTTIEQLHSLDILEGPLDFLGGLTADVEHKQITDTVWKYVFMYFYGV